MSKILTHRVLKQFEDDGLQRLPGECVDALPWRTAEALERARYIAPLPEGVDPIADADGRFWVDQGCLKRYARPVLDTVIEGGGAPQDVEKIGVALYRLPNGTAFRGSKANARKAAFGTVEVGAANPDSA